MLAYAVTQRTREIGIRMALGSQTRDVLRLVIGQGMASVLFGIVLGLIASYSLMRILKNLLYGVAPTDTLTFGVTTLLLIMISMIACWIPAQRAARIDPHVALKRD